MRIADTEPRTFCALLGRVLTIQQIKLAAEEPKEEGSLLERLVGAAYAAHIRAREAQKEAARAAAKEPAKTDANCAA